MKLSPNQMSRWLATIQDQQRALNPSLAASKGWVRTGNKWKGRYRMGQESFRGEVEDGDTSEREFYIFDPPAWLLSSSHGVCFRELKGKYWIHFGLEAESLDDGIKAVEHVIQEAWNEKKSRTTH